MNIFQRKWNLNNKRSGEKTPSHKLFQSISRVREDKSLMDQTDNTVWKTGMKEGY